MDPRQAAHAARLLGISAVIPMHYGTFPILAGTPEELTAALDGSGIEVIGLEIGVPAR
jgi:L-ascorbate metabolism protein UlaG (beta-lactamase superfamily)